MRYYKLQVYIIQLKRIVWMCIKLYYKTTNGKLSMVNSFIYCLTEDYIIPTKIFCDIHLSLWLPIYSSYSLLPILHSYSYYMYLLNGNFQCFFSFISYYALLLLLLL